MRLKLLRPALLVLTFLSLTSVAQATKIERVVSPGGIEAWLVHDKTVPLVALDFAFRGGAIQDPAEKAGVANLVSGLLDEGAGDLDAKTFHERLEAKAVQLGFSTGRDHFRGYVRTLSEHRDDAFELLRLALTAARFEPQEVERVRGQVASAGGRPRSRVIRTAGRCPARSSRCRASAPTT
jgi:zinc protease